MPAPAAAPFPLPIGTTLLGEVISWTCSGVAVTHRKAVTQFGDDTREDTLKRAADKIRQTRLKVSAAASGPISFAQTRASSRLWVGQPADRDRGDFRDEADPHGHGRRLGR